MRTYVLNIKYIIGLLVFRKSEQKFTFSAERYVVFVVVFPFFRSLLRFVNIIVPNLF